MAYSLKTAAIEKQRQKGLGVIGGVLGGAIGFVASGFNPVGAMAGYSIGAGLGGAKDASDQAKKIDQQNTASLAMLEAEKEQKLNLMNQSIDQYASAYGLTQQNLVDLRNNLSSTINNAYSNAEQAISNAPVANYRESVNAAIKTLNDTLPVAVNTLQTNFEQSRGILSDASQNLARGFSQAQQGITAAESNASNILSGSAQKAEKAITGGFGQALQQGGAYATAGQAGLDAFTQSALNPNNETFRRQLGLASENLNRQLAARGLYGSGAGIEAQSDLTQGLTDQEIARQVGLQQTLAGMGQSQAAQQAGLLSNQASQLAGIQSNLGINQANNSVQLQLQKAQNDIALALQQGQISQEQANSLISQATATANAQLSTGQQAANMQTNAATAALGQESQNQNTIAGLRQGLANQRIASDTSIGTTLAQLPVSQAQSMYNARAGFNDTATQAMANQAYQNSLNQANLAQQGQNALIQGGASALNAYSQMRAMNPTTTTNTLNNTAAQAGVTNPYTPTFNSEFLKKYNRR